jgi:phosphatidate cytidylyltransferase
MLRLISAAILAPLLWASVKLAPPGVFCGLMFVAVGVGCWEMYRLLGSCGAKGFPWLGLPASWTVLWTFTDVAPRFPATAPIAAVTIAAAVLAMWRRDEPREMLDSTLKTLFPVLFVGLALGHTIGLRRVPGGEGSDLLILLFICVMFADTAAFYGGTTLGRHRMAPRISPKKSWEGAAFGLAGSVGGALLGHLWFYEQLPLAHTLVLGLVLGVAAILGDLAQSMVKRAAEAKDCSRLIPGHGGLLDRADSLVFSAPILYYYFHVFLQGG